MGNINLNTEKPNQKKKGKNNKTAKYQQYRLVCVLRHQRSMFLPPLSNRALTEKSEDVDTGTNNST